MSVLPFYTQEQFESEKQLLLDKISESGYYEIDDPKEIYELFKATTAKIYSLDMLCSFAETVIVDNDLEAIKGEMAILNEIREHDKIKDKLSSSKLYREAQKMVSNVMSTGNHLNYDSETITLMIYLLHERGYFNNCRMEDEMLEFASGDYDEIGIVYARYFIMYEYLSNRLSFLEPLQIPDQNLERSNQKNSAKKTESFEQLFWASRRNDGTYNKVMDILSQDVPIEVMKVCEFNLSTPFVTFDQGKAYWNREWNYLAGLYFVCMKKGWIKDNISLYKPSVQRSFEIKGIGRSAFDALKSNTLGSKYTKPFEILFKKIIIQI